MKFFCNWFESTFRSRSIAGDNKNPNLIPWIRESFSDQLRSTESCFSGLFQSISDRQMNVLIMCLWVLNIVYQMVEIFCNFQRHRIARAIIHGRFHCIIHCMYMTVRPIAIIDNNYSASGTSKHLRNYVRPICNNSKSISNVVKTNPNWSKIKYLITIIENNEKEKRNSLE